MTDLTKRRLARVATWCVAALAAVAPASAHHAVLRFNLEEMTVTADRVFVGRCAAVDETTAELAGGTMPVTRYTFEVERSVKGSLPRTFTFTQLGHPAKRALGKGGEIVSHGEAVGPDTFIHGMAEYRVGDRDVLFLIPNYLGGAVTYPVGLYQGAFEVSKMPSSRELVRNGINNLGLFTAGYNGTAMKATDAKVLFPDRDEPIDGTTSKLADKRGALPLDDFLSLVDRINAAHGGARGEVTSR